MSRVFCKLGHELMTCAGALAHGGPAELRLLLKQKAAASAAKLKVCDIDCGAMLVGGGGEA